VARKLARRLAHVGEQIWKDTRPGTNERVGRVDNIERDVARVGIDHRLDAVAHVVERRVETAARCQLIDVGFLCVRIPVADGVGVEHPLHRAVDHNGVWVGIKTKEWRQSGRPLCDVAVVQDA